MSDFPAHDTTRTDQNGSADCTTNTCNRSPSANRPYQFNRSNLSDVETEAIFYCYKKMGEFQVHGGSFVLSLDLELGGRFNQSWEEMEPLFQCLNEMEAEETELRTAVASYSATQSKAKELVEKADITKARDLESEHETLTKRLRLMRDQRGKYWQPVPDIDIPGVPTSITELLNKDS